MISIHLNNLISAIILQAVKDYRVALSGNKVDRKLPKNVIVECELFFLSDWFAMLTNINGKMLIEQIRNQNNCTTVNEGENRHE